MIVRMRRDASQEDVDYFVDRLRSLGVHAHISHSAGTTLVGLVGELDGLNPAVLRGLRGVEDVLATQAPYRLVRRDFRPEGTVVTVGGQVIGGGEVVLIAGPCSVENREQLLATAHGVREAGARLLRGGAFKPRTSPYSFQGLAEEGLQLLAEAREQTGLPVVTEVMAPEQVPLVERYADMLQIGTRNMQNYNLLHAAGRSRTPVLLKRGMMATVEELLLSAEYIMAGGNHQVVLCERGIRTFERMTRNTVDINAVPLLQGLTHLPVVVDPSHGTGVRSLVAPVSRAAVAAGADGLLIEVHADPDEALSDGQQSISPAQFAELATQCQRVAQAVGRTVAAPSSSIATAWS